VPAAVARRLQPELLDVLPADDPRVRRCRRDLRLINWLMGNHRWIRRNLARESALLAGGLVELGAGDGSFLRRLRREFPTPPLAGFDLTPRPENLPADVAWHAGDLLQTAGRWPGTVLVANLFLHHFTTDQIVQLGRRLDGVRLLLIGEGHRSPEVLRRSAWLNPLMGEVTRHDMEISLQAGFVPGELPRWLGLDDRDWQVTESQTLFGAYRLMALRRT
jgi:hypothetical protein